MYLSRNYPTDSSSEVGVSNLGRHQTCHLRQNRLHLLMRILAHREMELPPLKQSARRRPRPKSLKWPRNDAISRRSPNSSPNPSYTQRAPETPVKALLYDHRQNQLYRVDLEKTVKNSARL